MAGNELSNFESPAPLDPVPPIDLSPLTYTYEHRIPVEVAAYESASLSREAVLDALLAAIGVAIAADRTLAGLTLFLEAQAPITDDLDITGAQDGRWADFDIVATYATSDPLN